ncbi:MAG TPA: HisA/HisF-related TIM barrel protein, partial [Armatimonadota bacterium]|nr:HisA/HisF-related TIM barrel protein [Armatimonadota bacterium]
SANQAALQGIVRAARASGVRVQFGGGLRSLESIEAGFSLGVDRVILGTAAIEDPNILGEAISRWGAERVGASLDVRGDVAQVRGWLSGARTAQELAQEFRLAGLRWMVYTDIDRDGMESGVNLENTAKIAAGTGLQVIASGGVNGMESIRKIYQAGLAGVIVGKALYSGTLPAEKVFKPEIWEEAL